ncbi:MAG: hypothetical protein K2H53_03825, partial [Clostridia bacterium]|nr:hypothetical protein [Clostridia bacterium]
INTNTITNTSDFVYDKDDADIKEDDVIDWFGTEDYEKYLVKLIRAEIASSYPKLGDYKGTDGTEDEQGNKKDSNGNYVAQGVVQIKRTLMDQDRNLCR